MDYIRNSVWSVFCSQGCYTDFMNKHWIQAIALAPRREALETPIKDPKKDTSKYYSWEIENKELTMLDLSYIFKDMTKTERTEERRRTDSMASLLC